MYYTVFLNIIYLFFSSTIKSTLLEVWLNQYVLLENLYIMPISHNRLSHGFWAHIATDIRNITQYFL